VAGNSSAAVSGLSCRHAEGDTEVIGDVGVSSELFDYFMRTCYYGGVRKGLADFLLIFRYRCNMNE